MADWLRCTAWACFGAGMLTAGSGAAARGIAGEMSAQSRASVTISVSVAPRFEVAPPDASGTIRIDSNLASGRYGYRFISDDRYNAAPASGESSAILIIVPD